MNTDTKLCVYAICKNESKFIDRWVSSLQNEADCVVVLDTGSTDDSVEKLKKYEPFVTVKQYNYFLQDGHFRFDKARNDSMKLIPFDTDICVVLDLDQVPQKGWASIIKEEWAKGAREVLWYIINHDPDSTGSLDQWASYNVHPNDNKWWWEKIIHECLVYHGDEEVKQVFREDFIIDHYPAKSSNRDLYKNLLEYACKEYPRDPFYGIHYGIELSIRYDNKEAMDAFERCIDECDFTNAIDIKYQCYLNWAAISVEGYEEEALDMLNAAKEIGIETRRIYRIYADIYERLGEYDNAIKALEDALLVQSNSNDWRDDANLFDGEIEDRLSLLYYYQKHDYLKSLEYCIKAIKYKPNDERIRSNLSFYYESFMNQFAKGEE